MPELLAEVVLGVESTAPGDLGNPQVAVLEQPRSFLEALFLQEVAEEPAGHPVETPRDVLPGVSQLSGDGLHGDLLVST